MLPLTTALATFFFLSTSSIVGLRFLAEGKAGGTFFFWKCLEAEGGVSEKEEETRRLWALLFGGTKALAFWRALLTLDVAR